MYFSCVQAAVELRGEGRCVEDSFGVRHLNYYVVGSEVRRGAGERVAV